MRRLFWFLVSIGVAGCAGAPPDRAASGGASFAGPSNSGGPAPAADETLLPARPLDAWERTCVAAGRDAERAASTAGAAGVALFGCLSLAFDNRMGRSFRLIQAAVQLDGEPLYSRTDPQGQTDLSTLPTITVFHGQAAAGNHTLTTQLVYQGVCSSGIYDYCRGYKFTVKSSHTFSLAPSHAAEIHVVAYEKGTVTTPIEERPAIRYEVGAPDGPSADAR